MRAKNITYQQLTHYRWEGALRCDATVCELLTGDFFQCSGSRNLAITHQQIIETLVTALVMQGNTIITSGGSSGTNAAAIRGAMKSNPEKLKVILPQTIGQQPSDVQDQLIGIPNIVEHSDRAMMTLADASRVCNREIIDDWNH